MCELMFKNSTDVTGQLHLLFSFISQLKSIKAISIIVIVNMHSNAVNKNLNL